MFRQKIPVYRRPTSDQDVASQVKRDVRSQKNTPKSHRAIFNGEKPIPSNPGMVKELYCDLLKRGGNWNMAKSNNDRKHISNQIFSENLGSVKELFFKLMKRGADPKMLTPSNKAIMKLPNSNINDDIGKAKELSFDPLEGRDNLRETNVPRSNRQKNSDQEGNSQYQSNTKNPEFQSKYQVRQSKRALF